MRSMTGFGRASLEQGGIRAVAEIRALNQRFFELKMNLPRGWGEHEARVRKLVQNAVSRGRVELFVRCVTVRPPPVRLQVNERLAKMYIEELRRLARRLRLDGRLGVEAIMNRNEIFHVIEEENDYAQGVTLGFRAIARALKHLEAERAREGRALRRDFAVRIRKIAGSLPKIRRYAEQARQESIAAFKARVGELIGAPALNEKRLYEEAAAAAQRGDVSEELTRLGIHLDALGELINRAGPVGKSIDFLLQEITREINTIGSKSQSAALSQLSVFAKGETEKMREQVQNVE